MSPLFKKSPPEGNTFLIVDIESGSVASALAHISLTEAPKLFGEKRITLPVQASLSSSQLARDTTRALEESLAHVSETAAYLRLAPNTAHVGTLRGAHIFLSAPWVQARPGTARLE